MAIRPVEMQGMVQRSQDVTHFKASENNRSNVEQMNIQGQQTKELQLKQERSFQAKRNAAIRKQYAHLNEKAQKFKSWLLESKWQLIVTARRKDKIYMRQIAKRKANYVFDLEKEKLYICQGKPSLADQTVFNQFENDWKEYYYGKRPKDRDFVREAMEEVERIFRIK